MILCDQRMPGMTGVSSSRKCVREHWPDAVRLVSSGYTDSEDIIAGINEASIYQYILKPWAPDHLRDSLGAQRGRDPGAAAPDQPARPRTAHQHRRAAPAHRHADGKPGGSS
ncbi:hypothetical protein AU476_06685 [Cupriavidus sp. UYMSc13B]|nr:hypothetical protein AU476_06685 [Cupriavidus sp. UYMSc13B]